MMILDPIRPSKPFSTLNMLQGTVVALCTFSCMFGSLSCYSLRDNLGRIRTIAAGSVFVRIHPFEQQFLPRSTYRWKTCPVSEVRDVNGDCAYLASRVLASRTQGSPRGSRGSFRQCWACSIASSRSGYRGTVRWRFPPAVPVLFALIIPAALPFMPDSPRWLAKKDRIEDASAVLSVLEDAPSDSPVIKEDISKLQASLAISAIGKTDFRALLRNGQCRLLNRTLLAMFSTFSQQINGIGVIGFYTTTIFEELLGLSPITARGLSVVIYVWQVSNTFIAFYTIDRIGRRKLVMFGNLGMGTIFIIVAGTVSQAENSRACAIVAAICVFLIATFFGIGALGINYLYGTEVAPLRHRVPIYALTSGTLSMFNFLVVEITPVGFANIGYTFFIIFAVIDICLLFPGRLSHTAYEEFADNVPLVVYFFLPETRRRFLEDMDLIFSQASGPLGLVCVAKSLPMFETLVADANVAYDKKVADIELIS